MIESVGGMFKDYFKLKCDSCFKIIASCQNFEYEENEELCYSHILCESCGRKHNQSIGEYIKKIEKLETKLKWTNEKIQQVMEFLEGRVDKLEIRKEELLKRSEVL